ncbi:hypothetical protein NQD34_018436 [Periophthalmus magnuspinnatus]|nr:hypothetical protein NQD34_018436 [Periophthalmus magnuspinnatus]
MINDQEKCLSVWMNEAERRDRKKICKQAAHANTEIKNECEKGSKWEGPKWENKNVCDSRTGPDGPSIYSPRNPFTQTYTPANNTGSSTLTQVHNVKERVTAVGSRLYPDLSALSAVHIDPDLDLCPPVSRAQQPKSEDDEEDAPPPPKAKPRLTRTTPVALRSTAKTAGTSSSFPMVEAVGPDGPVFVYRPWGTDEVENNARTLPDPAMNGTRFATEFRAFYEEFRPSGRKCRKI